MGAGGQSQEDNSPESCPEVCKLANRQRFPKETSSVRITLSLNLTGPR